MEMSKRGTGDGGATCLVRLTEKHHVTGKRAATLLSLSLLEQMFSCPTDGNEQQRSESESGAVLSDDNICLLVVGDARVPQASQLRGTRGTFGSSIIGRFGSFVEGDQVRKCKNTVITWCFSFNLVRSLTPVFSHDSSSVI